MYYSINYLAHHGVKGQSWGKRNGPPYPLNNDGKTKLQKQRIENYVRLGKAKVDNLADYTVGSLTTMITSNGERFVSGLMNGHDFDWQEVTKLTSKKAGLNNEYVNPAEFIKRMDGDAFRETGESILKEHERGRLSQYEIKTCNPGYGSPGTIQNCAKNSAALQLRMLGYNVAAGRQTYPSSVDSMSRWFKGAERVDYETENAEEMLKSYGNKTSGTISIQYANNSGGHSMHWTVDDEGTFEIQDGQNGRTFNSVDSMMSAYHADKTLGVSTFRLDNCEPDWDGLAQDGVVRSTLSNLDNRVKNKISGKIVDTW